MRGGAESSAGSGPRMGVHGEGPWANACHGRTLLRPAVWAACWRGGSQSLDLPPSCGNELRSVERVWKRPRASGESGLGRHLGHSLATPGSRDGEACAMLGDNRERTQGCTQHSRNAHVYMYGDLAHTRPPCMFPSLGTSLLSPAAWPAAAGRGHGCPAGRRTLCLRSESHWLGPGRRWGYILSLTPNTPQNKRQGRLAQLCSLGPWLRGHDSEVATQAGRRPREGRSRAEGNVGVKAMGAEALALQQDCGKNSLGTGLPLPRLLS